MKKTPMPEKNAIIMNPQTMSGDLQPTTQSTGIDGFDQQTRDSLGYYVYALVDPRKEADDRNRFFYIGKGQANRCFSHAQANTDEQFTDLETGDSSDLKKDTIRNIRNKCKQNPPIIIVSHSMEEEAAYELESILIKMLGTTDAGNRVNGHRSSDYVLSTTEIKERYQYPILLNEIENKNVLIVSLNGGTDLLPYGKFPPDELCNRVRGKWKLAPKNANQVELIVGVYKTLVRGVFEVTEDIFSGHRYETEQNGSNRKIFNGRLLEKHAWIGRPIVRVANDDSTECITKFNWGQPFRYLWNV